MAKGQIMYGGAAKAMLDHFSAMDYVCPLRYNPADYVLFLMQVREMPACLHVHTKGKCVTLLRASV